MLWWIAVGLIVLWIAGMVSGVTLGNFIHLLFIGALVILVVQLFSRRAP